MITITCVKKPSEEYTLLTGKTYSVGRKTCDMTFTNDQSISRNHATILVDHPIANIGNPALPPSMVVTDLGSKFGTFVNDGISKNERVAMREPNTLQHDDRFRFGLQWNEFKISYTPLISTSSGTIRDAPQLKSTICELGAHLLPEWREGCSYLITEALTLTVKAVCALLSAKHIVTPKFFFDYLEAVKGKTKLPDPSDYLPPLAEKLRQPYSFEPNKARTKLFHKKIFLFSSQKQAKKIGVAVRCAGGVTDLISSVSSALLKSENTIIISSASDVQPFDSGTKAAIGIYQSAKKRIIPESDIGFAAVYANTDFHCNPFVDVPRAMFPNPMSSLISQSQQSMASASGSHTVIPETQLSFAETQKSDGLSQSRVAVDETIDSSQTQPGRTAQVPQRVISLTQTQSQSMEFAVPTPRIKDEKDKSGLIGSGSKISGKPGSTSADESAEVISGTKRRRDPAKTNSIVSTPVPSTSPASREPNPKRSRSETSSVQGSRYTSESSKTLSSIFNMSDDDEDNEEPNSPTQSEGITAIPEETPVTIIPPAANEIPESQIRNKSPVKNEQNDAQETIELERLKRKNLTDSDSPAEVAPNTSKKRRVNQSSAEASKTFDGFIKPQVPTAANRILAWSSDKRVEPIPESDIKPLPFKFVALIKSISRPAMFTPEKTKSNGSSSAFNFKSFIKVLPLYMSATIINSRQESNTQARRKVKPPPLKAYDSHGFVDSEPYVAPSRITRAGLSVNTSTGISASRLADESMDTSVEEILQSSYETSNSSTRRSNRNNRNTSAANVDTGETSSSANTSSKKRTTRLNIKRSGSPPPLPTNKEEANDLEPQDDDDEWAFGSV